jgi:hypothetical protein
MTGVGGIRGTVTDRRAGDASPETSTFRGLPLGAGVFAFLLTAAFLGWGLARPAFWIDESASVAATKRTWPHLFHLLGGPEAPLVPYYAVLKPLSALGADLGLPLEAVYRWPSVAAIAFAAGFLTAWLSRRFSPELSLATQAVLLLTAGISRYGQEARPYAFTALFGVLATIAWYRLREAGSRRPRSALTYALALGALACMHLLAVTLVFAHLVAAALLGDSRRGRVRDVLWTLGAALLGGVLSAPFTLIGAQNAKGPGTPSPVTAERLGGTFVQAFTWSAPFLGVGWVLLLAAVGAFALALRQYRTVAVVALCWAVVPLAVLVPVMIARPTLLRLRYLVFVLPGWALLGGLGVVVLGRLVFVLVKRVPVAVLVAGVLVVALGFTQWPSLTAVRSPRGHGENVRPALAFVEAHPKLPVLISGRIPGSLLAAYRPDLATRLLGARPQYDGVTIWPDISSTADRRKALKGHDEVVVLVRNTLNGSCRRASRERAAAFVERCMPEPLARLDYRVVSAEGAGEAYAAAVVRR